MMHMPMAVVIVEGQRAMGEALAYRLAGLPGVRAVATAGSVDAAVPLVHQYAPALVLYDPRTVAGNPEEVVWRLGADGSPVVVLSVALPEREYHAFKRAGAAAIVAGGPASPVVTETVKALLAYA